MKKRVFAALYLLLLALPLPLEAGPVADLGAITIRSDRFPSGAVTLRNGEYRGPATPGSAAALVVKLTEQRAFGAVNGKNAAVAVIATNTGGSGTFFDLALLVEQDGVWVNVDTFYLGDRVKVRSIVMGEQGISVAMAMHGPGDALCCPTGETTRRFAIQADRLVELEGEKWTNIDDQGIIGPVWRWVRTRYADDATLIRSANADGYTVQLRPDGTVQVRGDCNVSGGSFTLKNNDLAIAVTYSTRVACPEGSLEDAFIRDLNRTGRCMVRNGGLYLDLKLDAGTMEFRK